MRLLYSKIKDSREMGFELAQWYNLDDGHVDKTHDRLVEIIRKNSGRVRHAKNELGHAVGLAQRLGGNLTSALRSQIANMHAPPGLGAPATPADVAAASGEGGQAPEAGKRARTCSRKR